MLVTILTKFDERHCHKWALLMRERQEKIAQTEDALAREDFAQAKDLFKEVFHGFPVARMLTQAWQGRFCIIWL